jgi:hypothetical protein
VVFPLVAGCRLLAGMVSAVVRGGRWRLEVGGSWNRGERVEAVELADGGRRRVRRSEDGGATRAKNC